MKLYIDNNTKGFNMNTIVIIITLQLFSGGVVVKTTEEIYLPSNVECRTVVEKYNAAYKEAVNKKLISITCKTTGEM